MNDSFVFPSVDIGEKGFFGVDPSRLLLVSSRKDPKKTLQLRREQARLSMDFRLRNPSENFNVRSFQVLA